MLYPSVEAESLPRKSSRLVHIGCTYSYVGYMHSFCPSICKFFRSRGSIPSLRKFDLLALGVHIGPVFSFLMANTQLSTLSLQQPIPAAFFETHLLPLLFKSFSKLASLSLVWEDASISDSALNMISSLNGLQKLHLSAGKLPGSRRSFRIDHKAMQRHLQKLVFLKKLAFRSDSYNDGLVGSSVESY